MTSQGASDPLKPDGTYAASLACQLRNGPFLCPDENGEVEIQAYSFTENEDGTEGDLQPIPEDSDAEWDMIEEVFNSFMEE